MCKRSPQFALVTVLLLCAVCLAAGTTINLATQVTGVLPTANGGTAQNSTATFPTSGTVTITVASGTTALGTSAISSGACSSTVSVAASGVTTSDTVAFSLNAAPSGTNLYAYLNTYAWTTSGDVNFAVCNASASSRTPTAMSVVWHVHR